MVILLLCQPHFFINPIYTFFISKYNNLYIYIFQFILKITIYSVYVYMHRRGYNESNSLSSNLKLYSIDFIYITEVYDQN